MGPLRLLSCTQTASSRSTAASTQPAAPGPSADSPPSSAATAAARASRMAWAWLRRRCSASSSAHSPSPGARRSTSPICQTRRSRSVSRSAWRLRAASRRSRACFQVAWAAASAAVSTPARLSSRARTGSGRVRPCQACWPWMSTSQSPSSRSWLTVAGAPLIHARLLPWLSTVRRSSRLPPPRPSGSAAESKPPSDSQPARPSGVSNSAAISARAAPSRTTPLSARWPRASCRASIRMDLPAPVSPVRAV